jgi:hypothetical protein
VVSNNWASTVQFDLRDLIAYGVIQDYQPDGSFSWLDQRG